MDGLGISLIAGFAIGAAVMLGEVIVNAVKLGAGWEQEELRQKIARKEIFTRIGISIFFVIIALIYYWFVYNN